VSGWKWLISGINGMPHRVPDNPGVVASYVGRGYELTDIDGELASDSEEFAVELAKRNASADAEELRGKALDDALDDAGLSKSGTVADKQARLAEFNASQGTEADAATIEEGNE